MFGIEVWPNPFGQYHPLATMRRGMDAAIATHDMQKLWWDAASMLVKPEVFNNQDARNIVLMLMNIAWVTTMVAWWRIPFPSVSPSALEGRTHDIDVISDRVV